MLASSSPMDTTGWPTCSTPKWPIASSSRLDRRTVRTAALARFRAAGGSSGQRVDDVTDLSLFDWAETEEAELDPTMRKGSGRSEP
jgi:hypothetical protein